MRVAAAASAPTARGATSRRAATRSRRASAPRSRSTATCRPPGRCARARAARAAASASTRGVARGLRGAASLRLDARQADRARARSRERVRAPERRRSARCVYLGIPTNVDFLRRIVDDAAFGAGELRTDFLDGTGRSCAPAPREPPPKPRRRGVPRRASLRPRRPPPARRRSRAAAAPWRGALRGCACGGGVRVTLRRASSASDERRARDLQLARRDRYAGTVGDRASKSRRARCADGRVLFRCGRARSSRRPSPATARLQVRVDGHTSGCCRSTSAGAAGAGAAGGGVSRRR